MYSAIFFVAGGLIYLYRNELKSMDEWWKPVISFGAALLIVLYYLNCIGLISTFTLLLMFVLLTIAAIPEGGGIKNPVPE